MSNDLLSTKIHNKTIKEWIDIISNLPPNAELINKNELFTYLRDNNSYKSKYPVKDGNQYDTIMIYEIFDEIEEANVYIHF